MMNPTDQVVQMHRRTHYADLRRDCAVICRRIEESSTRRPLPGTVAPIERCAA